VSRENPSSVQVAARRGCRETTALLLSGVESSSAEGRLPVWGWPRNFNGEQFFGVRPLGKNHGNGRVCDAFLWSRVIGVPGVIHAPKSGSVTPLRVRLRNSLTFAFYSPIVARR